MWCGRWNTGVTAPAAPQSLRWFHRCTQGNGPCSPSHPGTEGWVWSFFQSCTALGTAAVPDSMWAPLQSGDLTSPRQSHFSTQLQLKNTSDSIIKDYLTPDKNSLEALKAPSAQSTQSSYTLWERQLSLQRSWAITPLLHFILVVSGLCKFSFQE